MKIPMQNYALLDLIETACKWKRINSAENTPTLVVSKWVTINVSTLIDSHVK